MLWWILPCLGGYFLIGLLLFAIAWTNSGGTLRHGCASMAVAIYTLLWLPAVLVIGLTAITNCREE